MWTYDLSIGLNGSLHFWWRLLAASLFLYGLWSLVTLIIASIKRWQSTIAASTSPSEADELMAKALPWKSPQAKRVTRSASKHVIIVMLSISAGWFARDLRQYHHTYILNDVQVLRRDAPDKYLMQAEWGQPFEMKFCSDYIPELPTHITLKTLVYEDRRNCKSIANKQLGYLIKRDSEGRMIKLARGE